MKVQVIEVKQNVYCYVVYKLAIVKSSLEPYCFIYIHAPKYFGQAQKSGFCIIIIF